MYSVSGAKATFFPLRPEPAFECVVEFGEWTPFGGVWRLSLGSSGGRAIVGLRGTSPMGSWLDSRGGVGGRAGRVSSA